MSSYWIPDESCISNVVDEFGTPTYLYSEKVIINNILTLKSSLGSCAKILYSLKANPNVQIVNIMKKYDIGSEVSSYGELVIAKEAGMSPEDIVFVGPGKSDVELRACIEFKIQAIVCESESEIIRIIELCNNCSNDPVNIIVRLNPSFKGGSETLKMSGKPRQFGVDDTEAANLIKKYKSYSCINIVGFHAYMGTRILSESDIINNTLSKLSLFDKLAKENQIQLSTVDVGGGLGVPYYDGEKELDIEVIGKELSHAFHVFKRQHPGCEIVMEIGRYLVANSGVLITKVIDVKESKGETFAITNGGMNIHLLASGLGSFSKKNLPYSVFKKTPVKENNGLTTITGPLCTPTDILIKKANMSEPSISDQVVVYQSGAYGPTASPVYFLSHGYPAEVMHTRNGVNLIRERDCIEDSLKKQFLNNKRLRQNDRN